MPEKFSKTTHINSPFIVVLIIHYFHSDELNIFTGIMDNMLFFIIIAIILFGQIILITFAGIAFSCYTYYGLTIEQWLICVGFGSLGLVVAFIIKFVPDTIFPSIGKKEIDPVHSESRILSIKGNRGEDGLNRKFSSINHNPAALAK